MPSNDVLSVETDTYILIIPSFIPLTRVFFKNMSRIEVLRCAHYRSGPFSPSFSHAPLQTNLSLRPGEQL